MGERNGTPGGGQHDCPFGNPRCGRWRRLLPFRPWFCSRCCELLAATRVRTLSDGEVQELGQVIADIPGKRERAA